MTIKQFVTVNNIAKVRPLAFACAKRELMRRRLRLVNKKTIDDFRDQIEYPTTINGRTVVVHLDGIQTGGM